MRIRDAVVKDADALSALAVRSKAHWGYDESFMSSVRVDLEVTAAQIEEWIVRVLDNDERIVGFYALQPIDAETVDLERLFVDPLDLEQGHGRRLLEDAIKTASNRRFRSMQIASDPYAEPFYLLMGATRIGTVSSPLAGRHLPLLHLDLQATRT